MAGGKSKYPSERFRTKSPRLVTITEAECYADSELFKPWHKMTEAAKKEFSVNGPIPCEGGGWPGFWCDRCRFGRVIAPVEKD